MKSLHLLIISFLLSFSILAEVKIVKDIAYKAEAKGEYEKERCKVDLYLSGMSEPTPVIIWFHGGGLKAGSKEKKDEVVDIAKKFADNGVAFVAVNYRLNPGVKFPAYIDDAAASVKWTVENAEKFGFNKKKIFVGGHSAGGYLTLMLSFKSDSTKKCGLNLSDIAGFIPVSGQTTTHTTVRGELGVPKNIIVADAHSPLYHSYKMKLPIFLLAGDKDLKMRAEENRLLFSAIKEQSPKTLFKVFSDRNHVSIITLMVKDGDPVFDAILKFIHDTEKG